MKKRTIKFRLLYKGQQEDYEEVLLATIGSNLSKLSCMQTDELGKDYFVPDCDYEVIIRPVK